MKKEIEKIDVSVKQFTLPHSTFSRIGGGGIDIAGLAKNLRHIETALVKLGVRQCKHCNQITDSSLLGIGGICERCWIEDESVYDYDFSSISENEIIRHFRKTPMFGDMERRDSAILKANPNHNFTYDPRFELRCAYSLRFHKDNKCSYRWSLKRGVHKNHPLP
jgi:hypothetical protein